MSNRQGMTLMEVLLVLAIVAILAALTWPALERPLAHHRLNSAADEVRSQWCQARVEAMRSGHTYAFRYEVGGDHFYIEAEDSPDEAALQDALPPAGSIAAGASNSAANPAENKTLPSGVKFSGGQTSQGPTSSAPAQAQPAAGWSNPIFFYPDGTTSDVQLVLTCNQTCALRVMLRGSTATATVADAGSTLE